MAEIWDESWTEIWSAGDGESRSYCAVAQTADGFAVDVFHGDACVDSTLHPSFEAATAHAKAMRHRYLRVLVPTSTRWDTPATP